MKSIKEQEANGLLSCLRRKTALSKIPLVDLLLFLEHKMNKIVNKFLLAGDKFASEINWRQAGFTYSARGPFTKK